MHLGTYINRVNSGCGSVRTDLGPYSCPSQPGQLRGALQVYRPGADAPPVGTWRIPQRYFPLFYFSSPSPSPSTGAGAASLVGRLAGGTGCMGCMGCITNVNVGFIHTILPYHGPYHGPLQPQTLGTIDHEPRTSNLELESQQRSHTARAGQLCGAMTVITNSEMPCLIEGEGEGDTPQVIPGWPH